MPPQRLPKPLPLLDVEASPPNGKSSAGARRLSMRLEGEASCRLLEEVWAVLRRRSAAPLEFRGTVGERMVLAVTLADAGDTAAESLARRLIRLPGMSRLVAERVVPGRGVVFAIRLFAAA